MGFHLVDDLGVLFGRCESKIHSLLTKKLKLPTIKRTCCSKGFPHEGLFLVVLSVEQVGEDVEARKWTLKKTARRRGGSCGPESELTKKKEGLEKMVSSWGFLGVSLKEGKGTGSSS